MGNSVPYEDYVIVLISEHSQRDAHGVELHYCHLQRT
jgi:hypothetical protein